MIEVRKKSWSDITISDYKKMLKISEDEYLSPIEKDAGVLAVICGCEESDIWNLGVNEFNILRGDMEFLNHFDFPKDWKMRKMKIAGEEYEVQADVSKFTVSQYMDYQSLWKSKEKHMGSMLTVFLVPRGKKYNEGYDINRLAEVFEDNVSIMTYNSICFFFLRNLVSSTSASQIYSILTLRRMIKREKDPGEKEKLQMMLDQMEAKPVLICYV